MSRLKDLIIDIEQHIGELLNDEGLTKEQALNVVEQSVYIVGGQTFKGQFPKECAEQIMKENQDDLYNQPYLEVINGGKNED